MNVFTTNSKIIFPCQKFSKKKEVLSCHKLQIFERNEISKVIIKDILTFRNSKYFSFIYRAGSAFEPKNTLDTKYVNT